MKRQPALDGLRGLAILLVMLSHLLGGRSMGGIVARTMLLACHEGWLGVDLFFVLSGFLITSGLLATRHRDTYWRDFYAKRVLRIFPLYYGVLLVVFGVLRFVPACAEGVRQLAPQQAWLWTYTQNFGIVRGHFFNAPGVFLEHFWSLSIEEQFYVVWPLVVLWGGARLSTVCACIVALSPVARLAAASLGASTQPIYFSTPFRLDGLAVGALLACLRPHFRTLRPYAWIVVACTFGAISSLVGHYGGLRQTPYELAFSLSLASAMFGAMLVLALTSSIVSGVFSLRPLRVLGTYSYGLYVFGGMLQPHLEVWLSTARIQERVHSPIIAAAVHFVGHVSVALAVAMVSYHFYESRFLRLKNRYEADTAKVLA
jgi:peptidoglycan/LPS O-acetylase OafA/YrhL